jgi:hypothetical protein
MRPRGLWRRGAHSLPIFLATLLSAPGSLAARDFFFDAIRVQLSEERKAPAVSRVRDGQTFHIVFILQELSGRGAMDLRYTISSREGGTLNNDSVREDPEHPFQKGWTFYKTMARNAKITLKKGVREQTFTIDGTVTSNGVTQRRRVYLTVYR